MDKIEKLYPTEFLILLKNGRLYDDWFNVYLHCKKEGEVALVLSEMLHFSTQDSADLVRGAILHDWFKRNERESADAKTRSYQDSESLSYDKLMSIGISKRVCDIAHSVGAFVLPDVDGYDMVRRVMHLIDDICHGDAVVEVDERIDLLESAIRYKDMNESGRAIHGGRTYFEVQREVSNRIQAEIEQKLNLEEKTLINIIKSKL